MKFIPSENKRFLLEERFILQEAEILTEAEATQVAASWTTKFKNSINDTTQVLEAFKKFAGLSKANSTAKQKYADQKRILTIATQKLENTLDLPQEEILQNNARLAKGELRQYIGVLKQIEPLLPKTDETEEILPIFKDKIVSLEKISATSWTPQHLQLIQKAINWSTNKVAPLLDRADLESAAGDVEAFTRTCQDCLDLLKTIQKNLPDPSLNGAFKNFQAADLKTYCLLIKQLDELKLPAKDKLNKGLVVANIKKYQQQVEALKDGYTKLTTSAILTQRAADIAAGEAKAATEAELAALKDQTDWKTKLASAVNKENIIEEFIHTTWPEEAEKVINIKAAFLHECEQYGFLNSGEHQNPFITFISEVYLDPSYHMQPQIYNVIHNLVANNVLNSKDIVGTGEMAKGNLVFCKALYKLDPDAIKMYIRKQHNILQAATKPNMFASNAELAFNILYAVSSVQSGKATKVATDMQLRSIAQIEQLEEKWTGTVSSTAEDSEAKTKIAANAELLKQIKDTTAAAKLLVALAIKFSSNEKLTALVQAYTETHQLMKQSTTPIELQKLVASVENLYKITNITAAQALSLSKSVVESDQFEFTKE